MLGPIVTLGVRRVVKNIKFTRFTPKNLTNINTNSNTSSSLSQTRTASTDSQEITILASFSVCINIYTVFNDV